MSDDNRPIEIGSKDEIESVQENLDQSLPNAESSENNNEEIETIEVEEVLESTELSNIENADILIPESVGIEELKELKSSGDFTTIEAYLRGGVLEILPREKLIELLIAQRELDTIMSFIEALNKSIVAVTQKDDEIKEYVKMKADAKTGKVVPEFEKMKIFKQLGGFATSMLIGGGKFKMEKLPDFIQIFTSSFKAEHIEGIDLNLLAPTLNRYGVDLLPYIDLIKKLGLMKANPSQKALNKGSKNLLK